MGVFYLVLLLTQFHSVRLFGFLSCGHLLFWVKKKIKTIPWVSFMDKNDTRGLLCFTADSALCPFVSRVHLCVAELVSGCCRWQSHLLSPGIRMNFCLIGFFFSQKAFLIPDDWMHCLYSFFSPLLFLLVWSHDTVTLIFRVVHGAVYNWRHYAA